MPDLGDWVECNGCGRSAPWGVSARMEKGLPTGWTLLDNTTAGKVYFCSQNCQGAWTATRAWNMPVPEAVRHARDLGYRPPEPVKAPVKRKRRTKIEMDKVRRMAAKRVASATKRRAEREAEPIPVPVEAASESTYVEEAQLA